MKKIFLFCALLAGIAVMTGCQKDQDVVTLKAVIGQDTKAFFGGTSLNTPYWDDNDRVYIKGSNLDFTRESCSLELPENSTTFATISNMPVSDVYCAIFPASAVLEMGTPNAGTEGTTARISFKHDQEYIWDETAQRQRLEMPMGAVTTDNTLIFQNLCGILRVKVVNTSGNTFNVKRVSVISEDGTFIAGDGNITLYKDDEPVISMSQYHIFNVDQAIQLHAPEYSSMGTIYASSTDGSTSKTFDIIVPPFSAEALTFDVETELGYFTQTVQRSNLSVGRNDIAEITLTINSLLVNNHAYLIDGPTFNSRIRGLSGINGVTTIMFGNPVGALPTNSEDYVNLEASNSPMPVYGYIDANTPAVLHINTDAVELYANSDCSRMYQGLTNVINIQQTISFYTEDVTDMSYMYDGCSSLNIIPGFGNFVTTNVETMAYMFRGCATLGQLDLRSFSTQHLRPDGMVGMFSGCASLQTLYLNFFTTEQITTMEDLFNGCNNLHNLYINNFDMTHVSTKTNMCLNLGSNYNSNWPPVIYCNSDTWDAINTGTGLPSHVTHGE